MNLFRDVNAGSNRSVCFWNWNSDITREGILSQLEDFADGRIGGVIIHARAGLKIPYMGKKWMELFKYAVECSAKLGLEVWIYDEDGWPSGFASGKVPALGEEYCFKRLRIATADCKELEGVDKSRLLAAYLKKDDGYERKKEFELSLLPSDALVAWFTVDKHYVDLLNPTATKAFIDFTHEKYKELLGEYFGTAVKGFFTDEPQMNNGGYVWSPSFADEYKKRTGKDLLDILWLTVTESEEAHSFRSEYWSLISDRYFESFVKQLTDWCEENNLKLTGHFPAEDGLVWQLPACGDIMRNYSAVQLPAIDHLGSRVASPVLMKQVSSVSRQYRDGNVLSETYGCAGWGVTFRRLQWIWGGQSVMGVTKPCYHLSAYSMEGRRKRDYPAFYSYQEPWWDDFRSFACWMENLNSLMSVGERELDTLVIPPISGMKYMFEDDWHKTGVTLELSSSYRCLVENLLDLQLDFDLGDEYLINRDAKLADGRLKLGNISYGTVILAKTPVITRQLYDILKRFADMGGRVLVSDSAPCGFTDGTPCDFTGIAERILVNRRNTMEKFIEGMGICRPVTVARTDNLKPVSGLRLHTRRTEKGRTVHIWPGEDYSTGKAYLRFSDKAAAYKVNLIDNSREALIRLDGKSDYLVPITVNAGENLVIELIDGRDERVPEYVFDNSRAVRDFDIRLCEPNALTIDKAAISTDGGNTFGEPQQILKILDTVYADGRTETLKAVLRYSFKLDSGALKGGITLAFEDCGTKAVKINGEAIFRQRKGWWIDKCIGIYDIGSLLCDGENHIDLYYEIPPIRSDRALLNVFETEMNRFYYPVEPDSIYIRGDFDVSADGRISDNGFCYQTDGQFAIVPATDKKIGDLTKQGMWFYRGNVSYSFDFSIDKALDKAVIEVGEYEGTMLALTVGEKRFISHTSPASFDITEAVGEGENHAVLELIGHNRNLLGPHHYINGESYMVCPATFEGRWDGLAEFLSPWLWGKPTGTDDYGFIPFGIKDVTVKQYDKK